MRYFISLLVFLGSYSISFAQNCDCKVNFEAVVSQVKSNYAGYNDKVNLKNINSFNKFTNNLRQKALTLKSIDSCYVVLKTFTNYFKDQHLRVQLGWRYREKFPEKVVAINKQFPKKIVSPASAEKLSELTNISELDTETMLLRLPSFEWSEKKKLDSLLSIYQKQLKQKPYWVIDLRGNIGGTDYVFSGLLPFLYTDPIKILPDEYWSSVGNIQILKENLADENTSASSKEFLAKLINLMEANIGSFVNPSGKDSFTSKLDSVYPYPKKVGILIDRNVASSAESFLLIAKQSSKVKVFGENSAGVLDYANTQFFDLPEPEFKLVAAISRSKRLPNNPIDNIGIKPDVKIRNEEVKKVVLIAEKLKQ
ncbi:MAG: hypothetical protein EOO87_12815 [Pedobacter sp.]|nr:MAG: hypothetical protein EOO87_12815 [Pedobacter sp.]